MAVLRPTAAPVFATLISLVAALFAREFLRAQLIDSGHSAGLAKDLSYLAVPVILVILMWPILHRHRAHIRYIFRIAALTPRIVVGGIIVGFLARLIWWCHLVAGISFGLIGESGIGQAFGPTFQFECPDPGVIVLGIVVTAGLTPVVEETVHRGLLLSSLLHRGRLVAILVSTLIFTLAHAPSGYVAVLFLGLILALQYAWTGAIWFALATHATYNALIQLDWICLNGRWQPGAEQLPLTVVGVIASLLLLLATALVYRVMKAATSGTPDGSRM